MSTRTRPDGCCDIPNEPIPLPATERERLVAMFKALADPTRLDIFRLVAAQDAPICACDVVDRFEVSQPTISHHMKVLREAGLDHRLPARRLGLLRRRSPRSGAAAGLARCLRAGAAPGGRLTAFCCAER